MMRWRNHLFAAPVGTSAVGTWVADRRAADTPVADTPVADMPAAAAGWLIAVDFGDHLALHHNSDRHLKFFYPPHNKHKKPSLLFPQLLRSTI